MKTTKLYRVILGMIDEGQDMLNFRSITVVAQDAPQAIKKTRLRKHEYVESVEMLHVVDVK